MIFWITFLGTPILYIVSQRIITGGYSTSGTHIWVYPESGRKVSDATVRDVWKHRHPGKSWEAHEQANANTFLIFLLALMVGVLGWYSANWPGSLGRGTILGYFYQYGSGVLGVLVGFGFAALQVYILDHYFNTLYTILHVVVLLVLIVGIVLLEIYSFSSKDLPFSMHLLWIPFGAPTLVWGLGWLAKRLVQGNAARGGGKLEEWVYEVSFMYTKQWMPAELGVLKIADIRKMGYSKGTALNALRSLEEGKLDEAVNDAGFFGRTERVFLSLSSGKKLSLKDRAMVDDQKDIVQAVQQFYFYAAQRFGKPIHPRIQKLVKKV